MSALRLGRKPDGTRDVVIQEPARARVTGHGGTVAGYWSGTIVAPFVGELVKPGESRRDRELRMQREAMARKRAK